MNKEQVALILQLLDLTLKYGIPIVSNMIENMDKEVITMEDVNQLKIDMEWDDYFE